VDEELVELMSRAGFRDVDLGAESGCNVTLRGLGKQFRREDVLRAGKLLQEKKIPIIGDIPLIGIFFRSTYKRKDSQNVLFFIRPRILEGSDLNRPF